MRAVITVTGKDAVGILAKITAVCASANVNVIDMTQTVMQDLFVMSMLADISKSNVEFPALSDNLKECGREMALEIHVMHEDIFNSMHRI
ncbi:MAG: ACT domain-containing protein [Oscillospiraceae bacterium]|jgi:ACT domain-containing protein|nr:ACT domain-containing protein [Oscillospiraceae bacterium]